MMNDKLFKKILLVVSLLTSGASWAQVATVVEMKGSVQAIPAAGAPRDLRKGDTLNQGETVATKADAHAVIVFEDKQSVVLTGESRFKISSYTYNKMEPSKSSMLLELLEGGMQAITGLIGKAKPDNVTYKAADATISIRGTIVNVAVKTNLMVVTVERQYDKDGKEIPSRILFKYGSREVSINADQGAFINSMGQPEVRPTSEVLKAIGNTNTNVAVIINAVLRTATSAEVQRAITQAIKDAGGINVDQTPKSTTTTTPSNTSNPRTSGASGAGGGSASGR